MTFEDVKSYFVTSYRFRAETGMAATCWNYWSKIGYIPIMSQQKIEQATNGRLKLSWEDLK